MWKCKVDILSDLPSFENTKARLEMAHEKAFLRNDEFRIQFSSTFGPLKTGSNSELDILEKIYKYKPEPVSSNPVTSGCVLPVDDLKDIDTEDDSEDSEDVDSRFYEELFGLCEEDSNTNSKLESVIIEDMSLTDDELEGSFPDFETPSEDEEIIETIGRFTRRTVQEATENGPEDTPEDGPEQEGSSSHIPNSSVSSDTDKSSIDLSTDDVIISGDIITDDVINDEVKNDDVIEGLKSSDEPSNNQEVQNILFDIRSNPPAFEDLINDENDHVINHVDNHQVDDVIAQSEVAEEENLDSGISSASVEEFEEIPRPVLPPRNFRPVVTEDIGKNGHFKSPVEKSLSKMSASSGATSGYKSQSESSEYHYEESAIESQSDACCWLTSCPNPFSFFATRCRARSTSGAYDIEKAMKNNHRSGRTRNQSRTSPEDLNLSLEFSDLSTDVGNDILPGLII